MLFPSKQMQDWSKFAWKKGDVLLCGVDNCCIFKEWDNDEYTEFKAEFVTPNYSSAILKTKDWSKVTREDTIKQYIAEIEEIKGGKLNLETLEIEHPKPEFKDGDIVAFGKSVAICRKIYKHTLYFYACIDEIFGLMFNSNNVSAEPYRLATNSEKQQLFDALAKAGKRWNPDTLQIEDLPKKCEFKALDLLMFKNWNSIEWTLGQYSHSRDNLIILVNGIVLDCHPMGKGGNFTKILPYNDQTKHLLGTTDEWKGGEG